MSRRSEFGQAGMKPDPARDLRRLGLAEAAGLTGGYINPSKDYVPPAPAEDAYRKERGDAWREAVERNDLIEES